VTRDDILNALEHWINQRPGLEFGNYSTGNHRESVANYRSESRRITRQLHDARTLLAAIRWRTSIDVPQLREAFRAYSGRLTLHEIAEPRPTPGIDALQTPACRLEYCTGQYWPTEYRAAACAVLASALWDHKRSCMPSKIVRDGQDFYPHANGSKNLQSAGDWMRASFRKEYGSQLAARWFN
jgi:hypothetical protein